MKARLNETERELAYKQILEQRYSILGHRIIIFILTALVVILTLCTYTGIME